MITIFLGANPTPVARKWKAKDIQSLSNQSECAFNAIHCFRYKTYPFSACSGELNHQIWVWNFFLNLIITDSSKHNSIPWINTFWSHHQLHLPARSLPRALKTSLTALVNKEACFLNSSGFLKVTICNLSPKIKKLNYSIIV